MGKHFSKGKLCQMELTAGPKSRETAGHRGNQVMYTPAPPTISWQDSAPEDQGGEPLVGRARPGSSSFTHSHASPLGSGPPGTDSIIGTIFSPFSSYGSALGSPSFAFWEMRHTAGCRADTKMRRPLPRLHDIPVTGSSEVPKSLRTPCTQHSLSPPACYPCPAS